MSRRAITWWTVRALLGWVVVLGPFAVTTLILEYTGDAPEASWWMRLTLAVLVLLAAGHVLVMPRWRYRVHRWETTNQAVYTLSGWLSREWRVAPISRIQTVDTEQGPLQQLFGLTTVTVTTASAAGPLRIAGLERQAAQQLVDDLTVITQATKGDAT
ncbi:MAG TPA: PH domain-containing protein [Pseudonocardiaceae bacterium]